MIAPFDRVDPERRRVPQDEHVVHEPEQDDAGERADHPPAAALELDPADHRRREHGEDEVVPLVRRHREHLAGGHQPADRRERAGDAEDADPDAVDLDPGGARGLEVAADRVDGPSRPVDSEGRARPRGRPPIVTHAETGNPSQYAEPRYVNEAGML